VRKNSKSVYEIVLNSMIWIILVYIRESDIWQATDINLGTGGGIGCETNIIYKRVLGWGAALLTEI